MLHFKYFQSGSYRMEKNITFKIKEPLVRNYVTIKKLKHLFSV